MIGELAPSARAPKVFWMRHGGFLCFLFALALPATGLVAAQRLEEQSFPVQPGCTLRLDTYRGLINVVAGSDFEVRISVSLDLPNVKPEEAKPVLDGFTLDAATADNEVRLTARNPRDSNLHFIWEKVLRPVMIFTVTVPEHCNLDLRTKDGGITVEALRGDMRARGEVGSIFFRRVDGNVDAATRTGDVVVSRCTGAVILKSNKGNVQVGTVGGRTQIETKSGDIEIQTTYGPVNAQTDVGEVTVGFAQVAEASKIVTLLGNIFATVNPKVGCSFLAEVGWMGKITSRLTVTAGSSGSVHSRRLAEEYHGGGPLIDMKASSGHVTIEPAEPLFPL